MWKVLLVEDEPFVRRAIRDKIDWESSEFSIIGEAGDGEEALDLLETLQPDLVLADIVMPIMDGIDLLRNSREKGYDGCFVMLTCMNDFELARQALELGADGYMLKLSMTVQSLQDLLRKMRDSLERRRKEKLRSVLPSLDRFYIETWNKYLDPQAIGNDMNEWNGQLRELLAAAGLHQVVVTTALHGGDPKMSLGRIKEQLIGAYGNPSADHDFTRGGVSNLFLWYGEEVRQLDPISLDLPVTISVKVPTGVFPKIWLELLRKLDNAWYLRKTEVHLTPPIWPWKLELELIQSIERKDREAVDIAVDRLGDAVEKMRFPIVEVQGAVLRLGGIIEQLTKIPRLGPSEIYSCFCFQDLWRLFRFRVDCMLVDWLKALGKQTDHIEINRILDYIHQHYDHDISLKSMATMVAMDENYLSGLFKKKTSSTLIQYLQQIRVEQAKILLMQTDKSVLDIGARVGFASANYFFKIFKRWTGYTPSDYRKMVENAEG